MQDKSQLSELKSKEIISEDSLDVQEHTVAIMKAKPLILNVIKQDIYVIKSIKALKYWQKSRTEVQG